MDAKANSPVSTTSWALALSPAAESRNAALAARWNVECAFLKAANCGR
jgi:hypothetical protein